MKTPIVFVKEETPREELNTNFQFFKQLYHPNILQLHNIEFKDSRYYYTWEFIDGSPIKCGREFLLHIQEILDAIYYLISRGVVHTDLKPENILHAKDRAVIIDLAQVRKVRGKRIIASTPIYASPEVGKGTIHKYSDLFSIGVMIAFSYCIEKRIETPYKTPLKEVLLKSTSTETDPLLELAMTFLDENPKKRFIPYNEVKSLLQKSEYLKQIAR